MGVVDSILVAGGFRRILQVEGLVIAVYRVWSCSGQLLKNRSARKTQTVKLHSRRVLT